jgi:GH15 family glucan-1,4-alpha-glucosidase
MARLIEDYAIIGNCETAALVGRDGSMDWLGLPRFDSAACFAALLGETDNGRWQIAPSSSDFRVTRRYRQRSLILETEFDTEEGAVCLTDCMSRRPGAADVVRLVRGLRGRVQMRMSLSSDPNTDPSSHGSVACRMLASPRSLGLIALHSPPLPRSAAKG